MPSLVTVTVSASFPDLSSNLIVDLSIGAGDCGFLFGLPGINSTVPVCSTPCGPSDLAGFAPGLTGIIDGV